MKRIKERIVKITVNPKNGPETISIENFVLDMIKGILNHFKNSIVEYDIITEDISLNQKFDITFNLGNNSINETFRNDLL